MSEPYDHSRWEDAPSRREPSAEMADDSSELGFDDARENVFEGWPSSEDVRPFASGAAMPERPAATAVGPLAPPETASLEPELPPEPEPEVEPEAEPDPDAEPAALVGSVVAAPEHAPGALEVPPGYGVLEGVPDGSRRAVGIVVSRFNADITSRLLGSALGELESLGVPKDSVTVMPVPGAFELPIGAMALARTRRYACIVALGCVIRGDTPHFDYVASEAASGLQLAALETGVPVAFGVLTLDDAGQAEARIAKGAEAVRTGLEMADLFSHLRAAAAR